MQYILIKDESYCKLLFFILGGECTACGRYCIRVWELRRRWIWGANLRFRLYLLLQTGGEERALEGKTHRILGCHWYGILTSFIGAFMLGFTDIYNFLASRPGYKGMPTDVCVPISRSAHNFGSQHYC